ncbi:MAG: hypothetical protein A2Y57_01285 [Candidatus Woykebacteria bacterium RBG_13_40_7b]|uniref:Methyltransferase type 11 domain-containing protein n=1 Tax=Candidatus Woykebacteria bacterium RBG_13_40_7b TaxID=1802594 RepID=A0A1G1WA05_9BACT|nr:MAG: hypothetical protein A2Y57_01285 [Candidatus Woykebacteria bacterium RBG_13_40_7b]
MLSHYIKKEGLPKPILINGSSLPFPENSYPTIVSIRVLWHILKKRERSKLISELLRVSSQDIIADFTNQERLKNKLTGTLTSLLSFLFQQRYKDQIYFFNLSEVERSLATKQAKIEKAVPLDTFIPIWLNILPERIAKKLYPTVFKLDKFLAKIIPPTRYLLKISKNYSEKKSYYQS